MKEVINTFVVLFIIAGALLGGYISRKIFNKINDKDFPVGVLKDKLKNIGYTLKSYKAIDERSLPTNILFAQYWSLFRLGYKKQYFEIIGLNDSKKTEDYIYLKYYQTSSLFLNDRYILKLN